MIDVGGTPVDEVMEGAWLLSCGRWLMPDQRPEVHRALLARIHGPSCDHEDLMWGPWRAGGVDPTPT